MTDVQLYKRIQNLKPSLKTEVYDFVDFLLAKQSKVVKLKKPEFGCAKGRFKMSPDFDAPLDDLNQLYFDGDTNEVADLIEINGFQILQISVDHTVAYEKLELIHRDPFDRILVAQAMVEKMTIITIDENIPKYEAKTNW